MFETLQKTFDVSFPAKPDTPTRPYIPQLIPPMTCSTPSPQSQKRPLDVEHTSSVKRLKTDCEKCPQLRHALSHKSTLFKKAKRAIQLTPNSKSPTKSRTGRDLVKHVYYILYISIIIFNWFHSSWII